MYEYVLGRRHPKTFRSHGAIRRMSCCVSHPPSVGLPSYSDTIRYSGRLPRSRSRKAGILESASELHTCSPIGVSSLEVEVKAACQAANCCTQSRWYLVAVLSAVVLLDHSTMEQENRRAGLDESPGLSFAMLQSKSGSAERSWTAPCSLCGRCAIHSVAVAAKLSKMFKCCEHPCYFAFAWRSVDFSCYPHRPWSWIDPTPILLPYL